jgi:hypothetical protein
MNKTIRQAVKTRAHFLCEYCQSPEYFSPDPFECDHILAVSKGGIDDLDNLALSCSGCNGHKSDALEAIDPGTGAKVSLFNPRTDIWRDHFLWNGDFTVLIGISPVGRATILKLRLNRPSVVNLRVILRQVGELPFAW